MALSFPAPVGAAADMKELEYIAALHQTCKTVDKDFMNGSIAAQDIKYYLTSRYGIDVNEEYITSTIIADLGGGGGKGERAKDVKDDNSKGEEEEEEECLDIVEIIAILIIPTLLQYAQIGDSEQDDKKKARGEFLTSWGYQNYLEDLQEMEKSKPPDTLLADVLKNILVDVTGSSKPPKLTKELIMEIFATYDEIDLVQNEALVNQMIQAASGGKRDAVLDVEAFKRALTHDVLKYDIRKEMSYTTIIEDVFETSDRRALKKDLENIANNIDDDNFTKKIKKKSNYIRHLTTFPTIDLTAETFRSNIQTMSVLVAVIFGYMQFFYDNPKDPTDLECGEDLACKIIDNIIQWINVMLVLTFLGCTFSMLLSFGNHAYRTSCFKILIGMIATFVFFAVPTFFFQQQIPEEGKGGDSLSDSFSEGFWDEQGGNYTLEQGGNYTLEPTPGPTREYDPPTLIDIFVKWIYFSLGCIIFYVQLKNLIRVFINEETLKSNPLLSFIFTGYIINVEQNLKQASKYKIQKLLKNAIDLHDENYHIQSAVSNLSSSNVQTRNILKKEILEGATGGEKKENEDGNEKSTHAIALLNFTKVQEAEEMKGGFIWAWKQYLSGDLVDREGVLIPSRFLAGNIAQFVLLVIIFAYGINFLNNMDMMIRDFYPLYGARHSGFMFEPDSFCEASFNPSQCYFPPSPFQEGYLGAAVCVGVMFPEDCSVKTNHTLFIPFDHMFDAPSSDSTSLNSTSSNSASISMVKEICDYLTESGTFKSITEDCYEQNFYVPTTNLYAKTQSSTADNFCAAPVNACYFPFGGNEDVGVCLVGFDHFYRTPMSFFGDACEYTPTINQFEGQSVVEQYSVYVPNRWMVVFSIYTGITFAFLAGVMMSTIVIPSTVSTTLKFRTGVFRTLRNKAFNKYRLNIADTTYILGLMFWGTFVSVTQLLVIVSLLCFVLVYPITREYLFPFVGMIVGISITIILKTILVKILQAVNYVGFYRRRPALGNVASLALECWHLGLTVGYMFARIVKILLASSMYIGRVDTPILAEGTVGDTYIDKFPHSYRKGILSGEAHRHPYMERLGTMYLMKLRHKEEFGQLSGSVWRLLFVFALLPWMRKYRISDDADDLLIEKLGIKKNINDEDEDNYSQSSF